MFIPDLEYIIDQSGDSYSNHKIVTANQKKELLEKLHLFMKEYVTQIDDRVRYEQVLEKMLSLCPIVLNAIANRGYENVLFVGHYDQGKSRSWNKAGLNVLLQLLPVVHKEYGLQFNLETLRPKSRKNLGAIWYLYEQFGVPSLQLNRQYEHGEKVLVKDIEGRSGDKYDAIVFLNVPNNETSVATLRTVWKKFCVDGFDIIDINTDQGEREIGKNIHTDLVKAFSLRSESDRGYPDESNWKPELFEELKESVRVY